jgi:FAD/FMN-containing dehydrogenase
MRRYGLTIDSLSSCDVVTADGELLVASGEERPDLLWGLRGGGGNFGIITSFRYRLHPLAPTMLAGLLAWPMEQAAEVLRFYRDFVADAPDEVGIMANLRLAPALPAFPEELRGQPIVALIVCYTGPIDEGDEVVRPLREFKTPVLDTVGPMPYVTHQAMFDAAYPHGRHYYWKAWKLPPLTDAAIDVIVGQGSAITSPLFVASWLPDDPEPDRHKAWARTAWEAMRPFSHGVYVNFLSDEPSAHVRVAYGDQKYERLVALKNKYDPANVFRFNQNIAPST